MRPKLWKFAALLLVFCVETVAFGLVVHTILTKPEANPRPDLLTTIVLKTFDLAVIVVVLVFLYVVSKEVWRAIQGM